MQKPSAWQSIYAIVEFNPSQGNISYHDIVIDRQSDDSHGRSFWVVGCLCANKMRHDINNYVAVEQKTTRTKETTLQGLRVNLSG